jgi:hypothetical protein
MGLNAVRAGWERKLRSFPAWTAHRISRLPAIERARETRYRSRLAAHASELPTLTDLDARICDGLRRNGIFMTSLEALALPGSGDMFSVACEMAADYAPRARERAARGQNFLMVPPAMIMMRPNLFAWGLNDRLLNIAEAYLGLPPAYDGMAIIHTVADAREQSTRRWHRDREDRRMLKIAIYLNDVNADGGPFELDRRGEIALRADDPSAVQSCLGPAGTVIFADTARCLHRGRPAQRDRAALFYSYFSRRPRNSFFCERSGLSRAQVAALTRDLPPRQAESARWFGALPPILRMIPTAPI